MLVQIHHQFKGGRTEMCSQGEVTGKQEVDSLLARAKRTHPLPKGARWFICEQGSKHFILTSGPEAETITERR